jgi:hypothetical protein
MSQQGTPFGAVTPLNQARMSGETLLYCPLSKASAAPASADKHASRTTCASLRIGSSTAFVALAKQLASTIRIGATKPQSSAVLARSKNERFAAPGMMRRKISAALFCIQTSNTILFRLHTNYA